MIGFEKLRVNLTDDKNNLGSGYVLFSNILVKRPINPNLKSYNNYKQTSLKIFFLLQNKNYGVASK